MLIQIFQSGGFAGGEPISLGRIDTSQLPSAERGRVRELVDAITNPPEGAAPIGADMVEYRIELSDGGDHRTLVVADDMNPENPLLRSVHELIAIIGGRS